MKAMLEDKMMVVSVNNDTEEEKKEDDIPAGNVTGTSRIIKIKVLDIPIKDEEETLSQQCMGTSVSGKEDITKSPEAEVDLEMAERDVEKDPNSVQPGQNEGIHVFLNRYTHLEFLVIVLMPFLYGAATRLPFIYFVIHLVGHFKLDWWTVGLYVAAYQGCRVITSTLSIIAPRLSHVLGTSLGLAGYITVFVSDNNLLTPFAVGTAIVGFSETMSSMQTYAKDMYKLDLEKAGLMLKYQYAAVMIGVVFAFSIGGVLYQFFSINGVAMFGFIIEGLGLLSVAVYLVLVHQNPEKNRAISSDGEGIAKENTDEQPTSPQTNSAVVQGDAIVPELNIIPTDGLFCDEDESTGDTSRKQRLTVLIESAGKNNATFNVPISWVNWLLCLSFGIEALTIGYNLSIGPIFILNQFQKGTGVIGVLFAAGAASGTIAAIGIRCTAFGKKLMNRIASTPFDLCFAMGGIGVAVLIAAIPNFAAHVIGLLLLMCFNDLGATLMTELQGSITTVSTYSLLGPLGQVVRRCLNVVTALSGPILFEVFPRLPYLVAGGITLLWTILLVIALKLRGKQTTETIARETGWEQKSVRTRLSFAQTEMMFQTLSTFEKSSETSSESESTSD